MRRRISDGQAARSRRSRATELKRRPRPWCLAVAIALATVCLSASARADFVRGDVNLNGSVETADAVFFLEALYAGGPHPDCWDAADYNDNGAATLVDAVGILSYLFASAPPPAAPFPTAGVDPTPDLLPCEEAGVSMSSLPALGIVGSEFDVVVDNSGASSIVVEIHQGLSPSGSTDASFVGIGTSAVVPPATQMPLTLALGDLASSTVGDLGHVRLVVGGLILGETTVFDVVVESIAFNHSTSSLTDGVDIRLNSTTDVLVPEYLAGVRSEPALYVTGQDVTIEATLTAVPADLDVELEVGATGGGAIGGVATESLMLSGSTTIEFALAQTTPTTLSRYDIVWDWFVTPPGDGPVAIGSTDHTIYTVHGVPTAPWTPTAAGPRQPRVDCLEALVMFADGSDSMQSCREGIVQGGFDLPSFRYDTVSGSPGYGYFSGSTFNFNMNSYLSLGVGGSGTVVGCCYDSCSIMVAFANLAGDDLNWLASGSPFAGGAFGYLNCLDPIGTTTPLLNSPFYVGSFSRDDPMVAQDGSSGSCGRSAFGNHTFGGIGVGSSSIIYDLTCKFDLDSNPDTSAVWPQGTAASTSLTSTVLTDAGESWLANEFAGFQLRPNVNSTFPDPYQSFTILSNGSDSIQITSGSMTPSAQSGDFYEIFDTTSPAVDLSYDFGWDWTTYRTTCVDAVPSSGTAAPISYGFSIY